MTTKILHGALTAPCGYHWESNGESRFGGKYQSYLKEDKIMTREEKLYSMTGNTLLGIAEKLGLDVKKSILKQGKNKLIEKIMEAEANNDKSGDGTPLAEVGKEIAAQAKAKAKAKAVKVAKTAAKAPNKPIEEPEAPKAEETMPAEKKAPKRANLKLSELTYKGETKTIKEWAAEINMPWPTLYDRVNRNGWPVDLAIETPLGQRRPKNV